MREILGDYENFIRTICKQLNEMGISRDELSMMDHICYRVETEERYRELRQLFQSDATLLGEVMVSGRMISTFEFVDYLHVDDWIVPYLELPAPKEGSPYKEGLEHVELVVIGSLERFMRRHSQLTFSRSGMEKIVNPEAGLKEGGISVKFHEQQLGAVVRIEKRLGMQS